MIHSWIEELAVNEDQHPHQTVKELTFEEFCANNGGQNLVVFLCLLDLEVPSVFVVDCVLNRQGFYSGFQIHGTGTTPFNFRPGPNFQSQVTQIVQRNQQDRPIVLPLSEDGTTFNSLMLWEQNHPSEITGMKLSCMYRKKAQTLSSAVKNDFPSEKHKRVNQAISSFGTLVQLNSDWLGYTGGLWTPQEVYYTHWRGAIPVISYLPKRLSNLSPFVLIFLEEEDEGFEPPVSVDFQCVQVWGVLRPAPEEKFFLSFFRASNVSIILPETPSAPLHIQDCLDLIFLKCHNLIKKTTSFEERKISLENFVFHHLPDKHKKSAIAHGKLSFLKPSDHSEKPAKHGSKKLSHTSSSSGGHRITSSNSSKIRRSSNGKEHHSYTNGTTPAVLPRLSFSNPEGQEASQLPVEPAIAHVRPRSVSPTSSPRRRKTSADTLVSHTIPIKPRKRTSGPSSNGSGSPTSIDPFDKYITGLLG